MSDAPALGAKLAHTGAAAGPALLDAARRLEAVGFDSLWVADHVVLPERIESWYPFEPDGVARWATDVPYLESMVGLAAVAAVTSRVRLGTAVLVLPQRNPLLLAKQAASIDVLSGGRLELGVGAGWLAEEFAALGHSFERRGPVMNQWMRLLRDCWTGRPAARSSGDFSLPDGVLVLPTPVRPIPLLVGGHTAAALRRAGRLGDGWLAHLSLPDLTAAGGLDRLSADLAAVRAAARDAGRDPADLRVVLRIPGSAGRAGPVSALLAELTRRGVQEVVVDVDADRDPAAEIAVLRAATL